MARVITYSRFFPTYHPKKGQPTYFVEKVWRSLYAEMPLMESHLEKLNPDYTELSAFRAELLHPMNFEPKHHTIRAGLRFKDGDYFSPRVWSGKPYKSKQIILAPDTEVKKTWAFEIKGGLIFIDNELYAYSTSTKLLDKLAKNDGLNQVELLDWFKYPANFFGQIICWNENIKY